MFHSVLWAFWYRSMMIWWFCHLCYLNLGQGLALTVFVQASLWVGHTGSNCILSLFSLLTTCLLLASGTVSRDCDIQKLSKAITSLCDLEIFPTHSICETTVNLHRPSSEEVLCTLLLILPFSILTLLLILFWNILDPIFLKP